MLNLNATAQFRKDRRRCVKRGYNMGLLEAVVDTLLIPAPLPPVNKDHPLSGNWAGHQECHIQSDWLLIYRIDGNELMLYRTGTHADLFGIWEQGRGFSPAFFYPPVGDSAGGAGGQ